MKNSKLFVFVYLFFLMNNYAQQRIGVVLSGGGAAGFAHIGLLKALEEAEIPIDYITGTSAGALVGSLYCAGFSPSEIEQFVLSENFSLMIQGKLPKNKQFLLYNDDVNSSLLNLPFALDSLFQKSLPTKLINPGLIDYQTMILLGSVTASIGDDWNNLFIPFRCVASDIANKMPITFRSGPLNERVRASMTYPFFINAIRVDGKLMYDGGIYNNFPANVLYEDFDPDFIIGSNVSSNAAAPTEGNLMSQLTNMLVSYTKFELPCEYGILLQPEISIGTFEFSSVQKAINEGYMNGMIYIDSIKKSIYPRTKVSALNLKRKEFRKLIKLGAISEVHATEPNGKRSEFVEKSIFNNVKEDSISFNVMEKRYFRTIAANHLETLFPIISRKEDGSLRMDIAVQKMRNFTFEIGGHVSSRSVNTGFAGLKYNYTKRNSLTIYGNTYFGRFYASSKSQIDFIPASKFPIKFSGYFIKSRLDYFRNFSTFFEKIKPSFLVQNEIMSGLKIDLPVSNLFRFRSDFRFFELRDDYYQTEQFNLQDTTDFTRFNGNSISFSLEQNSLNHKQWANSGSSFMLKIRLISGREFSNSGSTSATPYSVYKNHQWFNLFADWRSFLIDTKSFHLGIHGTAIFNSQALFANYTASLLMLSAYEPTPDMNTFFLREFRAPQYAGIGLNTVFTLRKLLDFRIDSYIFQPFKVISQGENGVFGWGKQFFKGESFTGAASLIFHSPIGPVRFTANYFPLQPLTRQFQFQFSYGYTIFNERAIK